MDLSIIIAHYDPGNHPNCLDSFHKTLSQIELQKATFNIEVIIADDGSTSNKGIQSYGLSKSNQENHTILCLKGKNLAKWKKENNYDYPSIHNWLYLPKTVPAMSKARIGNRAIAEASSKNLFFLDDDNYFISNNTIDTIINLFQKYHLIWGQIQDRTGRFRPYSSRRVQGTTFGVNKETIIEAGLFGEWTEAVSSGVDSDIWWKFYQYFIDNPHIKACYTSEIQTLDSCSKRWRPYIKQFFRHREIKKLFHEIYGCPNYRSVTKNPSRNKSKWIDNLT